MIVKIAGKAIEDEGDVRSAIRDQKPGEAVDFEISREGIPMTVKVTFGEQLGSREEPMIFGFNGKMSDCRECPGRT